MLPGLLLGVGVARRDLVHGFAEFGLAQEEQAGAAAHAGHAVLRRLAGDVGHVDAFAKGVAVQRRFRGRDAEALG